MPRVSDNLWYLFQELDMMDRFEAAAKAGFKWVEFHFPYAWPAPWGAGLGRGLRDRAGVFTGLPRL